MKYFFFCLLLSAATTANCQQSPPPTLRSILLAQFQTTWNKEDWFVPVMQSLQGLTAKQAMWQPSDSSHSVGQLAYHLLFWNRRSLDKFNGKNQGDFSGDNKETFTAFTEASWAATVQQLDDVMKKWETIIKTADDAKLQEWYNTISHISTHNAYHTGQILYIRKLQGSWNPDNGVK